MEGAQVMFVVGGNGSVVQRVGDVGFRWGVCRFEKKEKKGIVVRRRVYGMSLGHEHSHGEEGQAGRHPWWSGMVSSLAVLGAVAAVLASNAVFPPGEAWAASTGGRVGGSQFRSVPSAPSRSYGGGGGGGGGYFLPSAPVVPVMPFYSPFYFFPGVAVPFGGLAPVLLLAGGALAVMSLVNRVGSWVGSEADEEDIYGDTTTSVSVVKVGLLSSAKMLQTDLNEIARTADTGSSRGLHKVLQDTVLALVRNPEFWTHGSTSSKSMPLSRAESEFTRVSMDTRSKIREETLTNVDQLKRETAKRLSEVDALNQAPAEYIVVTILVASTGNLRLPGRVREPDDLRSALKALGSIAPDSIQGLEVLWSPQAENSTLTEAELLLDNPELHRI
uniref:DUF1517 domain-containing protein n=1 Tax=Compsopogon caeruleus TaxID=31354 RepID=A0A7S1T647_9RHOD